MTIRRTSTLHDLIRGGDTWRHQLRMLFAWLGFGLLVGLVIALAVVGAVFYHRTEPNFRAGRLPRTTRRAFMHGCGTTPIHGPESTERRNLH